MLVRRHRLSGIAGRFSGPALLVGEGEGAEAAALGDRQGLLQQPAGKDDRAARLRREADAYIGLSCENGHRSGMAVFSEVNDATYSAVW